MWAEHATPSGLAGIARDTGALALVALDQRAGLRRILTPPDQDPVDDQATIDFTLDVARALGPMSSGIVVDREHGGVELQRMPQLLPRTGLVLAVDRYVQPQATGPVQSTELDGHALGPDADLTGVAAVKLLVIWRRDDNRSAQLDLARQFVETAASRDVASVLQPIVRPTDDELDDGSWDAQEAMAEAAAQLSAMGQSLYATQVPFAGLRGGDELNDACRRLAESISGPWVVSSHGVDSTDLAAAVTAACRAGASGFLAGESWWADAVGGDGPEGRRLLLHEVVAPRLQQLCQIVDDYARPWATTFIA